MTLRNPVSWIALAVVISAVGAPVRGASPTVVVTPNTAQVVTQGQSIVFDASGSSDGDGHTLVAYTWVVFGTDSDNGFEMSDPNGVTNTITFWNEGSYLVLVTIDDSNNEVGTLSPSVSVTVNNDADVYTFQEGKPSAGPYFGVTDAWISEQAPGVVQLTDRLQISGPTSSELERTFVKFDLSSFSLPGGQVVNQAFLFLRGTRENGAGGDIVDVLQASTAWNAGTLDWNTGNGVTGPVIGNFTPRNVPATVSCAANCADSGPMVIDVTTAVVNWIQNGQANNGLVLKPQDESLNLNMRYAPSEGGANGPLLMIQTMTAAGPTPPIASYTPTTDFVANVGVATAFDGSASNDPDGGAVTHAWTTLPTTNVTISAPTGATTNITFADYGSYTVTLTVTDDELVTATKTITVDVANVLRQNVDGYTGVIDTYINEQDPGNVQATNRLDVWGPSGSELTRTFIRFDLAGSGFTPPGPPWTLSKAELVLQVVRENGTPEFFQILQADTTWSDTTLTWTNGNTISGTNAVTKTARVSPLPGGNPWDPDPWIVDVTTHVTNWLASPSTNFGFLIKGEDEFQAVNYTFQPSEETFNTSDPVALTTLIGPQLRLYYAAPPVDPIAVISPSGTLFVDVGQPLLMDGASSTDPDGGALTDYSWSATGPGIGTFTPASGATANTSASFDTVGTYTVTLTVTDDDAPAGTDSTTATVIVGAAGPPILTAANVVVRGNVDDITVSSVTVNAGAPIAVTALSFVSGQIPLTATYTVSATDAAGLTGTAQVDVAAP